ncbi:MAG: hypothetical protein ACQESR_18355 [Planctomycetota bacterium]
MLNPYVRALRTITWLHPTADGDYKVESVIEEISMRLEAIRAGLYDDNYLHTARELHNALRTAELETGELRRQFHQKNMRFTLTL